MFGPELDTGRIGDWLDLYAAYDVALQDVVDHVDVTLCRNNGEEEHPFTYPLSRAERDVLRGEMEACCQRRTGRSLAQQYNHLLSQEEAEPPELTAGTRRIPVDKVSFTDELSECDGRLLFYVPVAFDPDAVFGTHVATAENDDWLNVYAVYDLDTGRPCPALDVTLVCGDGNEFAFRYPLTEQEQPRCCQRWTPAAWSSRHGAGGYRAGIWRRHSSPARPPAWPSCEHAVGPVSALCAGFRRRAGQGPAQPENRPVGAYHTGEDVTVCRSNSFLCLSRTSPAAWRRSPRCWQRPTSTSAPFPWRTPGTSASCVSSWTSPRRPWRP